MARLGAKMVPERSFVHPKEHIFGRNVLTKPAPYLFSGPNWLYGAFVGKIIPDKNFAQICLKSPLEFVFRKNTFSVWVFVLNRSSPIFLAKRTRWHDWGPALYLFSGPNWLYGAFGGKIVPDENFAQFCLKSPLEFVFPKNTFSASIFVLNRTSPILWAKRTWWRD